MIVDGLRQFHARSGGLDIGGGALAAEILGYHEQDALFANGGLLGARRINAGLAGAIAAPQGEVEDGNSECSAELLITVGPDVLGEAWDAETEASFEVGAVDGLAGAADELRHERRAREQAILLALGHAEVGQNHARVLLERQLDGVAQGELEGHGILSEGACCERQ